MKRIGNKPLTSAQKVARHRQQIDELAGNIQEGMTWQQLGTLAKSGEVAVVMLTDTPTSRDAINDLRELLPELHPHTATLLEDFIVAAERAAKYQD